MFKIEKEQFCSNPTLDQKWVDLAQKLINENKNEKDDLLKEFKENISSNIELAELAQSDLVKDDLFLIR